MTNTAARISQIWLESDWLNSCAAPSKLPTMVEGMPIRCAASFTAVTAASSAEPCARLKLKVAAGNCCTRLMASGAVVRSMVAKEASGTCPARLCPERVTALMSVAWVVLPAGTAAAAAPAPGTNRFCSTAGSFW
jgi:hypothetical protein